MFALVNSATGVSVTLDPTYKYEGGPAKIQRRTRTPTGQEFAYRFGSYSRYKVPVEYVTSADANTLLGWWQADTALLWVQSGSVLASVKIVDDLFPLRQCKEPYWDKFAGDLMLETFA